MNPAPAEIEFSLGILLVCVLLIPLAIAGLALINTGLGRSRSAAHAMTMSLCAVAVAILAYFFFGFRVQENHFGFLLPRGMLDSFAGAAVLFGGFGAALASLIPLGATADRWRLGPALVSTIILAGFTYPVFPRLISDVLFLGPGYYALVDRGGSGFINVTAGLSALSIAWLLGPRHGKYSPNGMPAAIPAHNGVFVLFGCMLAWVGWLGLNSAGAILYNGGSGTPVAPSALVMINTTFAACAAALASAATTRIRFRRPDASLIANGWMAGLVASSAGCATLKPATAILTGMVAGVIVVLSVELFELYLKVDDPCGSVSVHGVAGLWGLFAAGVFSGSLAQFMAQLVGIATLLGLIFPMTYGLNWLLSRFLPYRVSIDGERQGLDLHELGADAYPEFVVHADEFLQR
jgi:Amt family ammonium transporter